MILLIFHINLPRVVVIGAGFAGPQITNEIDTNRYQLVLIDKNTYRVFQSLLYQVTTTNLESNS